MRHADFRWSVRSLLVAVGLIGLNVGGAVTASKGPRAEPIRVGGDDHGLEGIWFLSDGSIYSTRADGTGEKSVVRILYRRLPPTTLQIWSPLLATVAISILAIAVPIGFSARHQRGRLSSHDRAALSRIDPVRGLVRWVVIGAGLIALNFAGAAYRPPPDRFDTEIYKKLIHPDIIVVDAGCVWNKIPSRDILDSSGRVWKRVPERYIRVFDLHRDESPGRAAGPEVAIPGPGTGCSGPIETVLFREDGSIVGYEGFPLDPASRPRRLRPPGRSLLQRWFPVPFEWGPGPMASPPYLIRPPLRSPLVMWDPTIGSASITLIVLAILWRRACGRHAGPDKKS